MILTVHYSIFSDSLNSDNNSGTCKSDFITQEIPDDCQNEKDLLNIVSGNKNLTIRKKAVWKLRYISSTTSREGVLYRIIQKEKNDTLKSEIVSYLISSDSISYLIYKTDTSKIVRYEAIKGFRWNSKYLYAAIRVEKDSENIAEIIKQLEPEDRSRSVEEFNRFSHYEYEYINLRNSIYFDSLLLLSKSMFIRQEAALRARNYNILKNASEHDSDALVRLHARQTLNGPVEIIGRFIKDNSKPWPSWNPIYYLPYGEKEFIYEYSNSCLNFPSSNTDKNGFFKIKVDPRYSKYKYFTFGVYIKQDYSRSNIMCNVDPFVTLKLKIGDTQGKILLGEDKLINIGEVPVSIE